MGAVTTAVIGGVAAGIGASALNKQKKSMQRKAAISTQQAQQATQRANEQAAAEKAKREEAARVAAEEEQAQQAAQAQREQSRRTALTNFLAAKSEADEGRRRFLTGAR